MRIEDFFTARPSSYQVKQQRLGARKGIVKVKHKRIFYKSAPYWANIQVQCTNIEKFCNSNFSAFYFMDIFVLKNVEYNFYLEQIIPVS